MDAAGAELTPVNAVLVDLEDREFPDNFLLVASDHDLELMRRAGTVSDVAKATVGANLLAQGLQGYHEAAHLVRLSPGTVEAIRSGAQVIPGTEGNLGVLRATNGRFAKQVQWTPAGSMVATMAAIGNAATMAVIQMQLSAISDQLTALSSRVDRFADSYRFAVDGSLRASIAGVSDVRDQAFLSGWVSDQQVALIAGDARDLDAHTRRLEQECRASLRRLAGVDSQQARREWLETDGWLAIKHLTELASASRAWVTARSLHAANYLSGTADGQEQAHRVSAEKLIQQTRDRQDALDALLSELGYECLRAFDVALRTDGRVKLAERAKGKVLPLTLERDQIRGLSRDLRENLLAIGIPVPPVPQLPRVTEIGRNAADENGPSDDEWRAILALLIRPDESVQLVVHGTGVGRHHNLSQKPSVLVFTDQRVLGLRKARFTQDAKLFVCADLSDISSVAEKPAYTRPQLRLTLREAPLGFIGGRFVDLGVDNDVLQAAIRHVNRLLLGVESPHPFGPDFKGELRRLDGGERRAITASAHGESPSRECPVAARNGGPSVPQSNRIQVANQTAWVHDSQAYGGIFHTYDKLALPGDHYGWHKVHVWLPPGYDGGTSRHSVIYANDGQQVFFGGGVGQNWRIQEVVQQSAAPDTTNALPIVVGIDWRERSNEYLHEPITRLPFGPTEVRNGGGLGPYSNYLADQIVPFIDANYRTIRERQHRVALGSSHGGLAAFFTGVSHGDVFGQVIAMSSSFWAGTMKPLRQSKLHLWTADNLRKTDTRPRIYIDWGLQRGGGFHNKYIEAWATSRGEDMRDILWRDFGYVDGVDLMTVADPDGQHNEDSWRRRLPDALRFALGVHPVADLTA